MKEPPCQFDAPPSFRRLIGDLQTFAQREPVQVMAIAVGAGLLLSLLPKRAVVGAVTGIGAAALQPTLLALGLTKALELCCRGSGGNAAPLFHNAALPEGRGGDNDKASARPSEWIKS